MLNYQSQHWSETSALVISSKVCRQDGLKHITYSPEIIYNYTVDGKTYESKEISYGFTEGGEKEAREKVALYPIGSQVKAFYNPSYPDQSCLEIDREVGGFAIPISAGIFLMVGGLWAANKARKENK